MSRPIATLLLAGALALAGCSAPAAGDIAQQSQIAAQTTAVPTADAAGSSAAAVLAENGAPTPIALAAQSQSAGVVQITLDGGVIAAESDAVVIDGGVATITAGGAYRIRGTLADGQIVVDVEDDTPVSLTLAGANISSSTSAPLYIKEAAAVEVVLADGTENSLADGAAYVYASPDENEPNAALFSDDPLLISGGGSLTVRASFNDGIASKNGLTISGGVIDVTAADDGIRGKDYLIVEGGRITVSAGGDGLTSDNGEDSTLGYISLAGGSLNITAGGDGIAAATDLVATAGEVTVTAGGGSGATIAADQSAKGLKAGVSLTFDGGTFVVDAAEDALHADSDLTVNGGSFTLAAGDDAVHGEANLTINGGEITVTTSYEGLEGANITLNAGTVTLVSSDDGVNAASGDGAANVATGGPGAPPRGGPRGGGMGGGAYTLTINGGTLVLNSAGDGLDANGTITMADGLVIINGPTERMNGALDYDGGFTLTGGTLVAVGSNGMAQAPDTSSSQNALLLLFDQAQAAGTPVQITDSAGAVVLSFMPAKAYQSLAFSSPALVTGATYEVALGGTAPAGAAYGLATGGAATGGSVYTSFTVEGVVTQIGTGGGFFR